MSKTIFNVKWLDLIPQVLTSDPQVQAMSAAITPQLQDVSNAICECILLARLDELDEEVVDLLAWQYHVDFYDDELTLVNKRALVRQAIDWHRRKGTPSAVKDAVSTVFSNGVVTEWFDYGGEPYYFRVTTDEIVSDTTAYSRLVKLINTVKNTRSWLDAIILHRTWSGKLYFGSVLVSGKTLTLSPKAFTMGEVSGSTYFGGALHVGKTLTLKEA
jgi:phage tail P2-like protein